MIEKLLKIFREKGEKRVHSTNEPFLLARKGTVLAFEKDPLNLFAVPKVESQDSSRHFLGKYRDPIFFSFWENAEDNAYEILAVSEGETISYEMSEDQFEALDLEFAVFFNNWVIAISSYFSKPLYKRMTRSIFPNESIQMLEGEVLVYKQLSHLKKEEEAIWIEIEEGKMLLFDEKDLQLTPKQQFFPLAYPIWVSCGEAAKVTGIDTLTLIQRKAWREARAVFASFFNLYFSVFFTFKKQEELRLLEERNEEQKSSFEIALMQMESVVTGSTASFIKQTKDPLQDALQYLGGYLGVEFVFPRTVDLTSDIEQKINLICDASQVQKRRVYLESKWWKRDNGPLLGFYGEDHRPVVLVNSVFSNYQRVDGSNKERVNVKTAPLFSRTAFMFYPPLPASIKKGKEVLLFFAKRYSNLIASVLVYSFIGSLIAFFPPIATKLFFRYALPQSSESLIVYLVAGLVCSSLGFIYFYFLRNLSSLKLEGLGAHMVQSALWDRLLKLSPEFFRKYSIGDLYWRATSIEEIREIITGHAATLSLAGLFSLLYLILMGFFSPLLMLTVIGFVGLGVVVTWIAARFKLKVLSESLEIQGKLRGIVVQMISGIGKLRVAGAEKSAFSYWAYFFSKHKYLQSKIHKIQNALFSFSTALPLLAICGVYAVTLNVIGIKGISLSDFLAFNVTFGSFLIIFSPLSSTFTELVNISPLWQRAKPILLEPMEERADKADPGELTGEILVDSVVFGYDPSHPPVLTGISLEIKPRKFIGIVGPSGSGKSTLLRILLGFETLNAGAVYYNGKDLSSLDPRAVRKQIGAVLQGQGIMAGNLYENIACGGIYTKEQIRQALELSGFDQDLTLFPMGLNTYVPMGAETLSGGQRQRLILARALLTNPAILILDEATSALDNVSQKAFTDHINSLNITKIVVAQRLSTLRTADMIYVVEKGTITQKGSFEELSQMPGFFSTTLFRQKI